MTWLQVTPNTSTGPRYVNDDHIVDVRIWSTVLTATDRIVWSVVASTPAGNIVLYRPDELVTDQQRACEQYMGSLAAFLEVRVL